MNKKYVRLDNPEHQQALFRIVLYDTNSYMNIENEKFNSAKQSGYPVYYQKITINYKLGKGILLFLYSRKGEFSTFFRITTKNYEPDDDMRPIYSSQRRKTGENHHKLRTTSGYSKQRRRNISLQGL